MNSNVALFFLLLVGGLLVPTALLLLWKALQRIEELEALIIADGKGPVDRLALRAAVIDGITTFHRQPYLHPEGIVFEKDGTFRPSLTPSLADSIVEHVEAKLNQGVRGA